MRGSSWKPSRSHHLFGVRPLVLNLAMPLRSVSNAFSCNTIALVTVRWQPSHCPHNPLIGMVLNLHNKVIILKRFLNCPMVDTSRCTLKVAQWPRLCTVGTSKTGANSRWSTLQMEALTLLWSQRNTHLFISTQWMGQHRYNTDDFYGKKNSFCHRNS